MKGYDGEERIVEGVYEVLTTRLNDVIDYANEYYKDGIMMDHVSDKNIYDDYVTTAQLVSNPFGYPALAFFVMDNGETIKNNIISMQTLSLRFELFTVGENGGTISKRYIAVLRKVLDVYYKEISECVFKVYDPTWRYFVPERFESSGLRLSELEVQIDLEVRR